MKKIYVKPCVELLATEVQQMICLSDTKVRVKPNAYWGEKVEQNQYAKDAWINEGHTGKSVGFSEGTVIPVAGDDEWDLVSRGNESLWED